jgi:hypothetical protein
MGIDGRPLPAMCKPGATARVFIIAKAIVSGDSTCLPGCLLVRSVGGKAMCCGLDGWACLGGWAAWAALVLELTTV